MQLLSNGDIIFITVSLVVFSCFVGYVVYFLINGVGGCDEED